MGRIQFISALAGALAFAAASTSAQALTFNPEDLTLPDPGTTEGASFLTGAGAIDEFGEFDVLGDFGVAQVTLTIETTANISSLVGNVEVNGVDIDPSGDEFDLSGSAVLTLDPILLSSGDTVRVVLTGTSSGIGFYSITASGAATVIPVPASALLLLSGIGVIALRRRLA